MLDFFKKRSVESGGESQQISSTVTELARDIANVVSIDDISEVDNYLKNKRSEILGSYRQKSGDDSAEEEVVIEKIRNKLIEVSSMSHEMNF